MLFRLEEGDYVAFPEGVEESKAKILLGRSKKIKKSGLIAIAIITTTTILLLVVTRHAIAPIAPIGVLIFGLALLKFYNSTVELFGGIRFRRRLSRYEAEGTLVWVPAGLKIRADVICRLRKIPVPHDLFSYDMPAASSLAVLYRTLRTKRKLRSSIQLREQLDALIDNRIAS
ncbi:MAG TPA: hypothetical protein VGS08_05405 [Candidatus Saccharimonadales bacterium]|nr:hypothetical protein [Candidatus Saccharimonadales bacterium]